MENMMSERERIEEFLENYKKLFADGNRAVCFSTNGDFFYYERPNDHGIYEVFVKFESAEELRSIIKTVMIDSVADNVMVGAEDLYYSKEEIRIRTYDQEEFDYKTELLRLLDCMEVIKRQTLFLMENFGAYCKDEIKSEEE